MEKKVSFLQPIRKAQTKIETQKDFKDIKKAFQTFFKIFNLLLLLKTCKALKLGKTLKAFREKNTFFNLYKQWIVKN